MLSCFFRFEVPMKDGGFFSGFKASEADTEGIASFGGICNKNSHLNAQH